MPSGPHSRTVGAGAAWSPGGWHRRPARQLPVYPDSAARDDAEARLSACPPLVRAVKREGRSPVWSCDPMHADTVESASGFKTRAFDTCSGK